MMRIARTEAEINEQLNRACIWEDHGGSGVPGMSFEQGVLYGLRWILGETDDAPIEEDNTPE